MLTVKFMKYAPSDGKPAATEGICILEGEAVHVRYEKSGRCVVQLGNAPGPTFEATVGEYDRTIDAPCMYSVAYIMNEAGRTVETIR